MEYRISEAKHENGLFCDELAIAAGQRAAGWALVHTFDPATREWVLTLPDGVVSAAALDALAAAHPKARPPVVPPPDPLAAVKARMKAGTATPRDVLDYLVGRDGL